MEQTTIKPRKQETTPQLEFLLAEVQELGDQVKELEKICLAKDRRIQWLERILAQRNVVTKRNYQKFKPVFESQKKKILQLFHELGGGHGLTHEEIASEFRRQYPKISTVNLNRRTRELVASGQLWSRPDPQSKKALFFLKLGALRE